MSGTKRVDGKEISDLSKILDYGDDSFENEGDLNDSELIDPVRASGHDDSRTRVKLDTIAVLSPKDMDFFHQEISKIPGYSIKPDPIKEGSFKVLNDKEIEVLKGDKDRCQMASPLDRQILNAYINAHKGEVIIVDTCESKEDAEQLIDTCNANKPQVVIKFREGVLDKFDFDSWVRSKHEISKNDPVQTEAVKSRSNHNLAGH